MVEETFEGSGRYLEGQRLFLLRFEYFENRHRAFSVKPETSSGAKLGIALDEGTASWAKVRPTVPVNRIATIQTAKRRI